MKANCDFCNKEFNRKPSALKLYKHNYCSKVCAAKGQKVFSNDSPMVKGHSIRNTGRTRFKKGYVPWNKGKKLSKEDRAKISGENSHSWKGGITPGNTMARNSIEFKNWRKEVFERDNYTCKGCRQHGGYLEPHHIFLFCYYIELRFERWNGITLCKQCHKGIHAKEE